MDQCIGWFRSYLCEQIFFIEIENQLSDYGKISCVVPQGFQALKLNLFLCSDDSCLMYLHRDVEEVEKQVNKDFESVCNWFVDNKLSIHFGEDKTKSILFAGKCKIKSARKQNMNLKI